MCSPRPTYPLPGLLLLSFPALSQNLGVAVNGGGGFGLKSGLTLIGGSIGRPHDSRHQWQFDYLFHKSHSRDQQQGHHLTLSYILEAGSGKARRFLQAGAGLVTYRYLDWDPVPPDSPVPKSKSHAGFATVWGGGVTIDAGRAFLVQPSIRLYTMKQFIIPVASVGVGRRF